MSVNSLDVLYREAQELENDTLLQINKRLEKWRKSPFRLLALAATSTKGAAGKKLAANLCREHGFAVEYNKKKGVDFEVGGIAVAVKFAMLGESGKYVFEQIRDRDYHILILLGVSPKNANVWCFRKEECLRCMKKQHAKDDRWVHVLPDNPPEWIGLEKNDKCITSQSGKLDDFAEMLSQKITACGGGIPKKLPGEIISGDNLPHLKKMASESVSLIYIDPPFNTGKTQSRQRICVTQDETGARNGFGGKKYRSEVVGESAYADTYADFMGFLRPRLQEAHRLLAANGSLFFHIDWREAARCRILLEDIFGGPEHCINEIIWAYDYGGRGKNRWPAKHDNIYWFAKDPDNYIFNYADIDRIPYMAPDLVGEEKAAGRKTPTDVWWNTIVPTNGREKTGYVTQKPLAILERIVCVHSNAGDVVLDFFAGSGTTGEAALKNRRNFILVDSNPQAIKVINRRLSAHHTDNPKTA